MMRIAMNRLSRLLVIGAVVSVAVTVLAFGYPGLIRAFNPQPDPPGSQKLAPVGVTASDTGQLNVANTKFVGESSERSCAVILRIFDSAGHVLVEERKLLRSGETASVHVAGPDVLGRDMLRAEIRGAVFPSSEPTCPLKASFEVIDTASGRTLVALGGPDT
jgi:hypothetical protein